MPCSLLTPYEVNAPNILVMQCTYSLTTTLCKQECNSLFRFSLKLRVDFSKWADGWFYFFLQSFTRCIIRTSSADIRISSCWLLSAIAPLRSAILYSVTVPLLSLGCILALGYGFGLPLITSPPSPLFSLLPCAVAELSLPLPSETPGLVREVVTETDAGVCSVCAPPSNRYSNFPFFNASLNLFGLSK